MAFDPALPADTTKIRLAPGVIQNNWVAIQTALSSFAPYAINLNNRTELSVDDDPTAIADTFITYCKDDGVGNPELFGINESSEITQFTRGLAVIAAAQTSLFLAGGLILKLGTGSFSGIALTQAVTYTTAFPTAGFGALMTNVGSSSTSYVSGASATTGFTAQRGSGGNTGAAFYWVAWGN